MAVFDYIFYKLSLLYLKLGEKDAAIPSLVILSLCQALNVFNFYSLVDPHPVEQLVDSGRLSFDLCFQRLLFFF